MDNLLEALMISVSTIIFCAGLTFMFMHTSLIRDMASASAHYIETHETINLTRELPDIDLWP